MAFDPNGGGFEQLRYSVEGGVARVRLDRPDQLNAFTSRLYGELKWAMRRAGADDSVDVVIVTGTGRAFATGGDLKETLGRLESGDPLAMYAFYDNLPWTAIRECPKVVIAAVNGLCLAGGLITAVCADIAVAVVEGDGGALPVERAAQAAGRPERVQVPMEGDATRGL
jgi:enoyl-CoA hydratase/carnithine racemase